MPPSDFRYPLHWRLMDAVERAADLIWPRKWSHLTGWLFIAPALLLVGLLVLGLVQMADQSLRVLDTATFLPSEDWSLANYEKALGSKVYLTVAWRSVSAALLTTFFTLLLAFPYAWALVRTKKPWIRKALLIVLFLPFFIGQVVRAYGWLIILGNSGMVNEALSLVGVAPIRLLFNYSAVIFGLVQYMLPFAVLLLVPALAQIPEESETAAASLGASWPRIFWHVLLPMAKSGLIGAGLVVFTLTLTDFAVPAMLGGGSQDFIANAIYDQFFRTADQGLGSALALMLVAAGSVLVGLVFLIFGAGTLSMGGRK